jgi:prolyl oligopeptidase
MQVPHSGTEVLPGSLRRVRYPAAHRLDVVDDLHGTPVPDPYRGLEDAASAATRAWCDAQDQLARAHLDALPGRSFLARRLRELLPGFVDPPAARGERLFFRRRLPDQEHPCYVVREPDGAERVLVDPAALSEDGTITLEAAAPSPDGSRLAYQLAEAGTEVGLLHVMDVDTGDLVDGPVVLGRVGPVAWLPRGDGLFYVRRLPDDALPAGEEHFHRRVWRHRVGSPVDTDDLVYGEGRDKRTYYGVDVSPDGRWLLVSASVGTEPRNDLLLGDLSAGELELAEVQAGVDALTSAEVGHDGRLYLHTNRGAPRWRLAVTDPAAPGYDRWRDLLPETDAVLEGFALTDTAVVAVHTRAAVSEVTVHDLATGEPRGKVDLPGLGTAGVVSRPEGGDDVWIGYTDHVTPHRVLHHRVSAGETSLWADAPGAPDTGRIAARQVFCTSADGTEVPLFVIARDDVAPGDPRPAVLYGYGGFNIPMSPAYASSIVAWAEQGGVYAVACLRGGSELGEEWHRAGMRERKQNVFADFEAAAAWLVAEGWSAPDRLGISGGSNGGLLVGAALTRRPGRYRSVVCSAPLLDMVRYELFGLGETWNDEYGTAADPEELGWLLAYSPYHHVREGAAYPAVLFTVFEGDSRVDTMHARKMCAALQWATTSDHPVLLRRELDVGHGQRSVSRTIDLAVDTMAFHAAELGLALPAG